MPAERLRLFVQDVALEVMAFMVKVDADDWTPFHHVCGDGVPIMTLDVHKDYQAEGGGPVPAHLTVQDYVAPRTEGIVASLYSTTTSGVPVRAVTYVEEGRGLLALPKTDPLNSPARPVPARNNKDIAVQACENPFGSVIFAT